MSEVHPQPYVPWWRSLSGELVVAVAATVLSLCAVATTIWQTSIMREQLRASVWPRLNLGLRYFTEGNQRFFRIATTNVGVGPAIVTDFRVIYRGKEYRELSAVFRNMLAEGGFEDGDLEQHDFTDLEAEHVIPQQQQIVLLLAKGKAKQTADLMRDARPHLQIKIQYASIYGQVWEVGFPGGKVHPVGWRPAAP
jgi:hypothetical protein